MSSQYNAVLTEMDKANSVMRRVLVRITNLHNIVSQGPITGGGLDVPRHW